MIALSLLSAAGLVLGFLLLVRVPLCPARAEGPVPACSIIIPARDEARTLPRLLTSINNSALRGVETVVVDDHSTDETPSIAVSRGARVVAAPPLKPGWTGKTSACVAGASAAERDLLLFLDADTYFEPDGLKKLLHAFVAVSSDSAALSVLPFHVTLMLYEEFSLFFNLLMAFGAGGFGLLGRGRLFGQSLLLRRELYRRSGSHQSVSAEILENFSLATRIEDAGGRCVCLGGRGALHMRMFPDGFGQLCQGWMKAFASGAAASGPLILLAGVAWLSILCCVFLWLLLASGTARAIPAVFYVSFALQIAWFASQVGSFRWYTSLLYPVPLLFFFAVFARSFERRVRRRPVTWKGRQV